MRDKNAVERQIVIAGETVGNVLRHALLEAASVFFCHAHFAVLHLDAGAQLQKIRAQQRHRRAAAALLHIVQPVEDKAGIHARSQLIQLPDDFLRRHTALCHPYGPENHQPVTGGKIARIDNVDVVKLLRGKTSILIA